MGKVYPNNLRYVKSRNAIVTWDSHRKKGQIRLERKAERRSNSEIVLLCEDQRVIVSCRELSVVSDK
jgi:hypothetical protein